MTLCLAVKDTQAKGSGEEACSAPEVQAFRTGRRESLSGARKPDPVGGRWRRAESVSLFEEGEGAESVGGHDRRRGVEKGFVELVEALNA